MPKKLQQQPINYLIPVIPIWASFIFFCILPTAYAQSEDATLRVIVTSEDNGLPVVSANILLTNTEGDTLHAGVTDVDGFHEFSGLDAGAYQITISFIGYETIVEEITLNPDETRIYRGALQTATIQIDEVVVGVQRGAVRREAGRQTISVEDIELIPAPGPGGDLSMYLQTLPAVVTSGDKGGEFFIRGGTPSQNMVLVDNMPVIKPFHISNLFSAFPQETINSVDFYAGGFGAEYIGATSSVLDVSLRQGNMKRFAGSGSASPYLVSFMGEGPLAVDQSSILFVGRHSVLDQTAPTLTGKQVPLVFSDMLARYSVNWPGFSCSITGLRTSDRGRINPSRDLRLTWENAAGGVRCLGYGEELSHRLDLTMGYSGFNSSERGIDDLGRESNIRIGYIRMDNGGELLGLQLDYGFRWHLTTYKARLDDPFPELSGREVRYPDLDSSLDVLDSIFSGYISLQWNPLETLTISPGLASQNRHRDMALTFEPRLRISWNPDGTDREQVTLAGGRYVQMMEAITDERDAGTVFYVYKPVEFQEALPVAWHGILGYRRELAQGLEANIEGYVKLQSNLPVSEWTRQPGNTIRTATADGFTYGTDLQLEYNRFPFYLAVGYGWSDVTYEAPTEDLVAWLDRPVFRYNPSHDLRHQLNVIGSYRFAGFTASASWRFTSGAPYTRIFAFDLAPSLDIRLPEQDLRTDRGELVSLYSEPFDSRLPSFHRLDVSLGRNFEIFPGFSLEAEVGAINAYDVRNVFYYDVNTFEQVDQTPLLPYASLNASFN